MCPAFEECRNPALIARVYIESRFLLIIIWWPVRSNPFLKSVKNHESPRSIASNIICSRYTKAWWVDFPEIANCLGSRCDVIHSRTLKSVNPSIIFVMWQVSDIGFRSFSTDCGSLCLSKGQIIALSGRLNTNISLSDVLYKSAITGPSSKAKVFNMRLKIPSGPHALFHFIARSALYASHDKTIDLDGISGTTIAATSLEVIGVKPDVSPAKNALILKHSSCM